MYGFLKGSHVQPWVVKYRRADDPQAGVITMTLSTPNEHLSVSEAGLYELLEVSISSTYTFVIL